MHRIVRCLWGSEAESCEEIAQIPGGVEAAPLETVFGVVSRAFRQEGCRRLTGCSILFCCIAFVGPIAPWVTEPSAPEGAVRWSVPRTGAVSLSPVASSGSTPWHSGLPLYLQHPAECEDAHGSAIARHEPMATSRAALHPQDGSRA
jgi:hypothetical protein